MKINFRKEVKKLIKKRNITPAALARKTKINAQTLYNYLKGRSEITSGNLEKILSYLR